MEYSTEEETTCYQQFTRSNDVRLTPNNDGTFELRVTSLPQEGFIAVYTANLKPFFDADVSMTERRQDPAVKRAAGIATKPSPLRTCVITLTLTAEVAIDPETNDVWITEVMHENAQL